MLLSPVYVSQRRRALLFFFFLKKSFFRSDAAGYRFSSDITNGPLQLFISGVGRAVDVSRLKKKKTLNVKACSRLAKTRRWGVGSAPHRSTCCTGAERGGKYWQASGTEVCRSKLTIIVSALASSSTAGPKKKKQEKMFEDCFWLSLEAWKYFTFSGSHCKTLHASDYRR